MQDNDVHENQAAAELAKALVPDVTAAGLECTAAFTGRVNLVATGPGIVDLQVERLIALNSVDPMISLQRFQTISKCKRAGLLEQ